MNLILIDLDNLLSIFIFLMSKYISCQVLYKCQKNKRNISNSNEDRIYETLETKRIKHNVLNISLNIQGKIVILYNYAGYGGFSFVFNGKYRNRYCTIKFVRNINNDDEGKLMRKATSMKNKSRHFVEYYDHQICTEKEKCFIDWGW